MVLDHLQDLFDPKDLFNSFSQLFMVCSYVAIRHIPKSIARALGVAKLITLAKSFSGIWPIAINDILLDFVSLVI